MATAPSPNDLTRQQLDELDALLQRMLSVPLAPVDTPMPVGTLPAPTPPLPTSPTPPSWRVDPPVPAASVSSPHLVLPEPQSSVSLKLETPPAPPPAPSSPPPAPAPKPPTKTSLAPAPLPKPVPQTPVVPPAISPTPSIPRQAASAPVPVPVPAPVPVPPPSATKLTPAPSTAPLPIIFLPFVVFNVLFDGICGMFGPPGRLLRSTFFKYLYGLIGLGLLFYTAAHVAQDHKWLTLPITLPWPPRM